MGTLVACVVAVAIPSLAEVKLPNIIGRNMVLQAEAPLPIWGWANPGEKVTVSIAGQDKAATAGADGRWKVVLDNLRASDKPQKMTVKGANEIVLENVLVGEVWVGSGQSNMEMAVGGSKDGAAEAAAANHPAMRMFLVRQTVAKAPADDVPGQWVECAPSTVGNFSAVLYYFGRRLHNDLKVPMGLIASAWGGTRIEPWTPLEALEAQPEFASLADMAKLAAGAASAPSCQDPTVLFNGMIRPILPFAIRGAIWYQGESNCSLQSDGPLYAVRMQALISGWRSAWGQGEFPFLFVQLAPWVGYEYGELPKIWQAQVDSLKIPNTGMAVITDVTGDVNDIHPQDKQSVGTRLALWALAKTYGRKGIVCSGPLYKAMKVEGDKAVLSFEYADGLKSRDGQDLTEFEIAGENKKFVSAKAVIRGATVVVTAPAVTKPVAARFGWHNTPNPNLCNGAGLPASPFRTDDWYNSFTLEESLCTGRPVETSGAVNPNEKPEFAVDGYGDIKKFWGTIPAPQWLRVDLQGEFTVDRISILPYWDHKRYYQYTIEVSLDGKEWIKVVDASQNTEPGTEAGYTHKFNPVKACSVKVNMLKNSDNPAIHLVDLRVYEAGK
jgi:sialate O-acetylesterase